MTELDPVTVLDPDRPAATGDPTRRVRRHVTTGLGVAGPVLFVLSNVVQPSLGHTSAEVVAHVAPIAGRVLATHLLYAVASLLLVPFALCLWRLDVRRGSALRLAGGALLVVGGAANAAGELVLGYSAWGMARTGVAAPSQVAFFDLLDSSGAALPIGFVAIPVLTLGLVLAMVGVASPRVLPVRWPVLAVVGALATGAVGTGPLAAVGLVWAAAAAAVVVLVARRGTTRP